MLRLGFSVACIAAGAMLGAVGSTRLRRPRTTLDVEWSQRHPIRNVLLGGLSLGTRTVGFDRVGAVTSVGAGVLLLSLGLSLLGR